MLHRYINFFSSFLNVNFFINISLISIFIRGLKSSIEKDIKKVIALSTLSQIRIILFIILVNFKNLSFFYICNHAFFKSILFINIGFSMINNYINQNFFNSKVYCVNRFFNLSLKISLLNLINITFFSSFFLKEVFINLIRSSFFRFINIIIFYFSSFFTIIYSLKLFMYSLKLKFNLNIRNNLNIYKSFYLFFFTNIFSLIFRKIISYFNFFFLIDNLTILIIYILMLLIVKFIQFQNLKIYFFLMYLNFLIYSFPIIKLNKRFDHLVL